MSTTDEKVLEEMTLKIHFENKIYKAINYLKQTKSLLFALSYNHQELTTWLANNPQFNDAIAQYKTAFLANKLHENKELQEILQLYFKVEKKKNTEKIPPELITYLLINPVVVDFLAENLSNLVAGATSWSRDQQAYFDYFDHKNQRDSLKTQLMTGFGKTSSANYTFPRIEPFSITTAYQQMTHRLEALKTIINNPIKHDEVVTRELFYLDHLRNFCQMQLNVSQFENQYQANHHNVYKLKYTLAELDALKSTFMNVKTQAKIEVDALMFLTNLKEYIRNYDWSVDYQLIDRFLDNDPEQKRIPTQVALQLKIIQQAQDGKITYTQAEYKIREIGASASQKNNSLKQRLLDVRHQSTKDYYDLFSPGNEKKLFDTVMPNDKPDIQDHPVKVAPT